MHSANEVASALREMARHYALVENSPHRARAYDRAAAAIEALGDRMAGLVADGRLTEVPGIADKLAHVIAGLHLTGTTPTLETLRKAFPSGLLPLAERRGFTLARLRTLHESLGLSDVAAVKDALLAGQLRPLKGFGPKVEERLLASLEEAATQDAPGDVLLATALAHAELLLERVRRIETVVQAEMAGALRRGHEMISGLSLVVATTNAARTLEDVAQAPELGAVLQRSTNELQARHSSGLVVTVIAASPQRFGTALLLHTGAEAHLLELANRAELRGWALPSAAFASEAQAYHALDLPFIPPELREGEGEIEAAAAGDDFSDLITLADLKGVVHCHTTHSDGKHSILQMAQAARAAGLTYITITDHSTSAPYAGGLTPDRLVAQAGEIEQVRRQVDVAILAGTESDITEEGTLDYPLSMLRDLDVVIGSVHNRFRMDANAMTTRLVGALTQPVFKIWGHPLGRLLGQRPPIACDVESVLDAASTSRTAIEINGSPYRLDLEPRWLKAARKRKLPFVISADAHSIRELDHLRFGVMMARRAGIRKQEVLNALPAAAFRDAVRP